MTCGANQWCSVRGPILGAADFFPVREAALGGFDFREAATFLFEQVVFDAADRLGRGDDVLPRGDAFADEHTVGFFIRLGAGRPVFHVHAANAAGVGLDPRDGIDAHLERGADVDATIRTATTDDVREACDVLRPQWKASNGVDGRVSIEVDPRLAHDTDKTILQAIELWKIVDRPNLLIKIPATLAGLPAITAVIALSGMFSIAWTTSFLISMVAIFHDRKTPPLDSIHRE